MPKYIPTDDDMYSTKPCFICGGDVIEEGKETCCDLCEQQMIIFKEDYDYFIWKDPIHSFIYGDEEDEDTNFDGIDWDEVDKDMSK